MAACDTLADEAKVARQKADEAGDATQEEFSEAWHETRKATGACAAAIGGFSVNIGLGLLAAPTCIEGIWDAVTSWCDVRESAETAGEEVAAAAEAQAAYLACLNDHKRT